MLDYYNTDQNFTFIEKIHNEKAIYNDLKPYSEPKIVKINYQEIVNRKVQIYQEREYHFPQNIFIIQDYKCKKVFVGRKCWSILSERNLINSPNCSLINYTMLFGILKDKCINDRNIKITFYPLNNDEKYTVFDMMKKYLTEIEVIYPYVYRDYYTNEEKVCSKQGWTFNPKRKINLSNGEVHFRKYTKDILNKLNIDNAIVYDPACSTGEFLYTVKQYYPHFYTIGHDISQEMIKHAKDYVDEYLCVDAKDTPLRDESVDILFLRFLNSEILSRKEAEIYFKILIKKVKIGKYCICFGHTPFLLKSELLKECGVQIKTMVGYSKEYDSIFQYYLLKRVK